MRAVNFISLVIMIATAILVGVFLMNPLGNVGAGIWIMFLMGFMFGHGFLSTIEMFLKRHGFQ